MNCQECLEELAIGSLRELQPDSPVMQHCATCPDCAALTTRLREREYDAATILNNLPPLSSPVALAETSATLSRRRRVGRLVVTLSGIAGAIIIALVASTMMVPKRVWNGIVGSPSIGLRTETIALRCLSPEQAGDIINPYVRSRGSVYYTPSSGISVITVRGTADEIARSRMLIHDFENDPAAACHHPLGADVVDLQNTIDEAVARAVPAIAGAPAGAGPAVSASPAVKPSPTKKKQLPVGNR